MAAINKPSSVVNKTVQINNYIQNNLEPLTEEGIKNAASNFTLEHHLQGVARYSEQVSLSSITNQKRQGRNFI